MFRVRIDTKMHQVAQMDDLSPGRMWAKREYAKARRSDTDEPQQATEGTTSRDTSEGVNSASENNNTNDIIRRTSAPTPGEQVAVAWHVLSLTKRFYTTNRYNPQSATQGAGWSAYVAFG